MDYQPYQAIESDQPVPSQLVAVREQTPMDRNN